jgi:uncharacterized protein
MALAMGRVRITLRAKSRRVTAMALLSAMLGMLAACSAPARLAQSPTSASAATRPAAKTPSAATRLVATAGETLPPAPLRTNTPSGASTPTPLPPNPLEIEYLRQLGYPGSAITFEQTLAPGPNYDRYVVSYLSEGLKIYALMTVPRGAKPAAGWPVIIFNHGYISPSLYSTTERYVAYVDALARSGYIVFKSDYRGNGKSEGNAPGGYGSPAYTIDVLNALASLKRYPDADPGRIGMWGHSMGGMVTLRAMVVSKEIKAGVIWAGVVGSYPELVNDWNQPSTHDLSIPLSVRRWREGLIAQYGTPAENPQFWASVSPNTYLGDLPGPLQLHHDVGDSEVPFRFSQELYDEVKQVGKTVELYSYPGDDHNLASSFSLAMQRTIAFFDMYVKG